MLDSEALRQIGKLIADCDRRFLPYAVTEAYLNALARAAADRRQARRRAEDRVMAGSPVDCSGRFVRRGLTAGGLE